MGQRESESTDARVHARNIKSQLHELIEHLRRDVERVDDARARALFETSAEVITGLEKAFSDFENHNEPAWQT